MVILTSTPTTAPELRPAARLHVAVGVLRRRDRRILIQQRAPGKTCAGQWEFPGGKVESGETPPQALQRELKEELGIAVLTARLLLQLPFDYAHARVWLEAFVVDSFGGEVAAQEGQQTRWRTPAQIRRYNLLAAMPPILDALEHGAHAP